ncbi:MAG: isopeptide-forming domain-containing fimbrial protein [Clostridia bacterium]|nr:isopeptide-forming domain-containing fimbrial protein [Clostridia bacterium]
MKGRINKALVFFVVIGLIISIVAIKNILPIKVSQNIQNIEQQPKAAMTIIDTITGWNNRVWSYAAHYGPSNEMAWGFYDTNSTNKYNNIYCVQTGKGVSNSDTYYVYDIYNLDSDSITKYFENETNYRHFLYILENMYLVGRTGAEKEYMENVLLNKIKEVTGEDCESNYNNMLSEINGLGIVDGSDAKSTPDVNKIAYMLWKNGSRQRNDFVTLDRRDNYLGTVQRYMLQSYIKQKDGKLGVNPAVNKYKWHYYKYEGQYNNKGKVPTNAQTYADALLKMLEEGFNNDTYDINKYKNFDESNTYINKDSAVYDETNNRIGPFTVVNPNGYSISVSYLKYGETNQEYDIVDENGSIVDISSKTEEKNFYLKLKNTLDGTNTLSANFYIDFGDVPTARIFIPKKDTAQIMTSVDRAHKFKNVQWTMKVDTMKADIALKKYIYAVNGSIDAVPARLESIDLSPLKNRTDHNAIYNMNKTPVEVNVGDIVTYAIQLFNEGEINATAEEITDYLPNHMRFVSAYTDFDAVHTPGYDGSNNITNSGTSNNIKIKNPNTDYIAPYDESDTQETFKNKSQTIYIDCKVLPSDNYIYTNVSEITEYRIERGSDIDSDSTNWQAPARSRDNLEWQNYSNGHSDENPTWFDNGFHNFGGQEDDDDFDKIIIKHIDLALTKRIEGKLDQGTEVMLVPEGSTIDKSRIEISGYNEVKNGQYEDLLYNMNKKVAKVEREDQLVSVITVYNEGHIDGIVKEITDYLPTGLNFTDEDREKTQELNGDNISFRYNKYKRLLTITINNGDGIKLNNIDEYEDSCSKFEVKIVTSVSKSASGRLFNSAAITDYGYKGTDGTYYKAYTQGVDKDSYAMQDANMLKNKHKAEYNAEEAVDSNLTQINKNVLQYQDDDDVDVVEVDYNPNFDLSLRKYIYKVEKNFYSDELIDEQDESKGYKKYSIEYKNRIPVINENSLNVLNSTGTAEYYHDKLKVHTEKDDLVTYRIRVYNEGKGNDYYGRATEITDYLPEGLQFVSLENGSDANWSAEASGNTIKLKYSGEKILPTDSIEILSKINKANDVRSGLNRNEEISDEDESIYNEYKDYDEHEYYQEVGIICRVTSSEEYKIITNRAAITGREAYEKVYTDETNYNLVFREGVEDRDNLKPDVLENPNLDNWYRLNVINEGTPELYYPGDEDDDDFDTIYVDTYKVKIIKSNGTDNMPGVELKVIKYRSISNPKQNFEKLELSELETSVKDNGVGEYISTAPTTMLENDVYIVKEIKSVEGYYNPFEGKYIKFSLRGGNRVSANYRIVDSQAVYIGIYEDNGDDDYTNDTLIKYDFRDPNSEYNNVNFYYNYDNELSITILNDKIESSGKYTINLHKYGENNKEIEGVQFDVSGKFNNEDYVTIPSTGKKLESKIGGVKVIPDSYTSEYIDIKPETYSIPDELVINEDSIKEGAVDSDGNLVDEKYYIGLEGKEIRLKINKNFEENKNNRYYYVESLDVSVDGNKLEDRNNSFTYEEDNGTSIRIDVIKNMDSTSIDIRIWNPTIVKNGKYNVNIIKFKKGSTTPVEGVHFLANAYINGKNETIAGEDSPITTKTTAVPVKENVEILEEKIKENDTYTITEKDVGTNTDICVGINKPIELIVEKDIDKTDTKNWEFFVKKVTMKIGNEKVVADEDGETITFDNGAEVTIKYNSTTKTIEIAVTNPKKEGSFELNLVKYIKGETTPEGEPKPLEGATFDITISDKVGKREGLVTDSDGRIPTIEGIEIDAENKEYTITVEETGVPTGYIGLAEPITFKAVSESQGDKYVLKVQEKTEIGNYFDYEVRPGEIFIEVENRAEPEIHKGVKTSVHNQDSGYDKNEKQKWIINSSIPTGIEDYTKYIITDTIDPEKKVNSEKRIQFINEDNPAANVSVKILGTDGAPEQALTEGVDGDYKVTFNKDTKELMITFINGDEFIGGKELPENRILEITYETQFALDDDGNIIGINQEIPNQAHLTFNGNGAEEDSHKDSEEPEVHTGGVGVRKTDRDSEEPLVGARFRLTRTQEAADEAIRILQENQGKSQQEIEKALEGVDFVRMYNEDGTIGDVWEVETDSEGKARFEGIEFGGDAEGKYSQTNHEITKFPIFEYTDWSAVKSDYYIVEVYVPEDYVLLKSSIHAEVRPSNYTNDYVLEEYKDIENHKVVEDGEYLVSIKKNGKYVDGEVVKTEGIPEVRFEAKRKVNRLKNDKNEKFENLTTAGQDAIVTDATGYASLGSEVTMKKESKDVQDIYIIKEKSIPETSKYLLGFTGEITLKINKDIMWSDDRESVTNIVKSIEMEVEGANAVKVNDLKYTAKVTKDGQELELVAEFNQKDNILELTIENPHKKGEFDLDIIKVIKGTNPAKALSGAGFKISIKDDDGNFVTDKDGNAIDGSKEYFVGTEGENKGKLSIEDINIKEAGINYNIEIEESTVPAGYIGIGQPIKYTATSVVYADKLGLNKDTKTISNDVKVKVEEGQVWIDVQNKPEPVIHKGVKYVENQDSGYDKNEIQTWVINSSIPTGISDYTKYVITDTIDPDITDNDKKRIAFINEENPASNVIVKIKGTNTVFTAGKEYSVAFDTNKKELKVTFIDGNKFSGVKYLTENSTLEITYKTQFTLDDNGNIIGLNQSIPNQAELNYNGNGKEEKTKKSEIPEVHTGGVGVFKYDDANKNGKYDEGEKALEGAHFRVTESESEAQKAVSIILKYEAEGKSKEELEEALKEIDFVKEKSSEGKETGKAIEVVTGKDGKAVIEGLEFGEDAIDKVKVEFTGVDGAPVYKYKWDEAETKYYIVETETPHGYLTLDHEEEVIVRANNYDNLDLTKYYELANKSKIYDLSLRKFITHVNGVDRDGKKIDRNITDRIPRVTLTDEFKDEENDKVTTAKYEHTKEPVVVQQGNIVTYTIRIYNEGPEDAYASIVKDDIPDGVEFVQYTEGDGSVNDEYRWKLVDDKDNEVTDASKAKYIITDYLSMEQGEIGEDGRNSNLLKKFDSKTMDELDYRDIKVQFRVIEPNTSDRILINYAQISEETDSSGKIVKDRDSIPNVWNEGEDDQDIEKIKLLYFDLALRKWVTKAVVVEDGQTHVFETGHKAEDDPEEVVKVDLKKSKLDKVVVKFEYQIRVTNQGKIGGWADEVTDHIPDGLKFEQADNPIWTPVNENTIVTDELTDVYLEPGESTEVTVVLTWINSGDNLGIKNNIAEISKDRNEYGVPDIDSTPGNYKWGEDDIDDAPVMLAIKTGSEIIMYVILGLGVMAIIGAGVAVIKCKVL